jgi:hypothetical protein
MTHLPTNHSFLLIDSAMLGEAVAGDRPDWLIAVYGDGAASVSPLVIDMQAVCDSGELDTMMAMLNAAHPQLHASIIDTPLSHAALVQHLRRFIMIRTDDGHALTLRFADCLGLPLLAATLGAEQWAAFAGPVARWCVHGRDGALHDLPLADPRQAPSSTPLVLSATQLAALADATAPDEMLANIREMRHDADLPGSVPDRHRWAVDARHAWRSAGSTDLLVLRWLTEAALDTGGAVLREPDLPSMLALQDQAAVRASLKNAVAQAANRVRRGAR